VDHAHSPSLDSVGAGAPASHLLKTTPKQTDNAVDSIRELNKRFKERLTLNNPRLVERYVKSELFIFIRFRIAGHDQELVARFEWLKSVAESKKQLVLERLRHSDAEGHHFRNEGADMDAPWSRTNGDQQTVFVDVVKSVEGPEVVPLPSLVRFEVANCIHRIAPHTENLPPLFLSLKHGFEFLPTGSNREASCRSIISAPGPDEIKLIGKVVEGTPEIVNSVASDHPDGWRSFAEAGDIINQLSCVRIALSEDFIGVGIEEDSDCRI
jgi:hypothetical protein